MKLVHIIGSLDVGGAETFLLRLLTNLDRGCATEVISLSSKGPIADRLERLGVPVTALGMRSRRLDPVKFYRLVRLLRRMNPDVVQTWMYHADLVGGLAARMAGIRSVVWSVHHTNLSIRDNKRLTLLVARICALLSGIVPDRILCVAQAARASHVRFGYVANKMTVIPNGFDLSTFHPSPEARRAVRAELGLSDTVPLVGFIARFDVQKNHASFLEIAARLRTMAPGVRFLLAGSEIDAGNPVLAAWIENNGLRDSIMLLGYRSDVNRLMAALDVLVLPSVGEGFPNVVGEAMASGVPCVVTDVGDAALLVGNVGFVRPVGDIAGLADMLAFVLNMPRDERAALGEKARQRIAENYEIGAVVRRYEALYSALSKMSDAS